MAGTKHSSLTFFVMVALMSMAVAAGSPDLADKVLPPPGLAGDSGRLVKLSETPHAAARSATAQPKKEVKIPFEFVEGLMVCAIPTSRGKLRLVFDTGANATALLGKPRPIEIRIGGKSLRLVSAPLRTSTLSQVNDALPPARRLEGILGEDVLVQFQRVTVDYKSLEIEFDP